MAAGTHSTLQKHTSQGLSARTRPEGMDHPSIRSQTDPSVTHLATQSHSRCQLLSPVNRLTSVLLPLRRASSPPSFPSYRRKHLMNQPTLKITAKATIQTEKMNAFSHHLRSVQTAPFPLNLMRVAERGSLRIILLRMSVPVARVVESRYEMMGPHQEPASSKGTLKVIDLELPPPLPIFNPLLRTPLKQVEPFLPERRLLVTQCQGNVENAPNSHYWSPL